MIQQAINRASGWALKKLTATYVTLHLSDIGKAIKVESDDEVRALLLKMVGNPLVSARRIGITSFSQIESNDVSAQISASGSVTFSDPPPQFTKEQVDNVLRDVQEQSALLAALDQQIGKNKEYLAKVRFSPGF